MKEKVTQYNQEAWDNEVKKGNIWTQPVESRIIESARKGEWQVKLTSTKYVPTSWFPPLKNLDVLCLASGGGQQGPILAAAGAAVTVLDNSPLQLAQDRLVAEREKLDIELAQGDMADLKQFNDSSFDFIFHPISNVFIQEVRPVWRECFRVLKAGGFLVSGFCNSALFLFDREPNENEALTVKYSIPYSDLESLSAEERDKLIERGEPLEFGHSLEDQLGGQMDAGFEIVGFYEDISCDGDRIDKYLPCYIATRARKPA